MGGGGGGGWVCTGLDMNFVVESPTGYRVQGLT